MYFKKWKDFQNINEADATTVASAPTTNQVSTPSTDVVIPTPVDATLKPGNTTNTTTETKPKEEEDVSKLKDAELANYLKNWNVKYSQAFKFENNQPRNNPTNNLQELVTKIKGDSNKSDVSNAINSLFKIFTKKELINSWKNEVINISGFTSSTGDTKYNQSLSERRAQSVLNAITNLFKEKNTELSIKFKPIGRGEDPNYLLIKNDTDLKPIQTNSDKYPIKFEDPIFNTDVEARQRMNRRVEISLPNYEYPQNVKAPEVKADEKPKEKPKTPVPTDIKFNYNSFILTRNSKGVVEKFCSDLKEFISANKDNDIKNIYISAHSAKNAPTKSTNIETQETMLAILSANRAQYVKDAMKVLLSEEICKNITFHVYPVAFKMSTEGDNAENKKVVITFDETDHMKKAKEVSKQLCATYSLPYTENTGLNDLTKNGKYLQNKALLSTIKQNVEAFYNPEYTHIEENKTTIPIELYYNELSDYDGLTRYAEERKAFLNEYEKKIKKLNKQYNKDYKLLDFVYKPQ